MQSVEVGSVIQAAIGVQVALSHLPENFIMVLFMCMKMQSRLLESTPDSLLFYPQYQSKFNEPLRTEGIELDPPYIYMQESESISVIQSFRGVIVALSDFPD